MRDCSVEREHDVFWWGVFWMERNSGRRLLPKLQNDDLAFCITFKPAMFTLKMGVCAYVCVTMLVVKSC